MLLLLLSAARDAAPPPIPPPPPDGLLTLWRLSARRLSAWLVRSRELGTDEDGGLDRPAACCCCRCGADPAATSCLLGVGGERRAGAKLAPCAPSEAEPPRCFSWDGLAPPDSGTERLSSETEDLLCGDGLLRL